jgi:hypothetical protein
MELKNMSEDLPTKASNGRYAFTIRGNLEDPSDWEVISGYPFTRAGYWDLTVWYSSGSPYFSLNGASYESDAFLKALPLIVESYPTLLDWRVGTGSGYDPKISDLLQKAVDIPIHRKTYLHGTSEAALEKIEQMGLLPPSVSGAEPSYGAQISSAEPADPRAIYLTTDFATASWASRDAANKARSSRVILEVLPPFMHILFGPDVDSGVSSAKESLERLGAVAYFGEIPPEQVRVHAYFDSDLDKWVFVDDGHLTRTNPESSPYVYLLNCTQAYFDGGAEVIGYINDHQEWDMDLAEFAEYVDLTPLDHLELDPSDWSLSFFESELPSGQKVYVLRHSLIEYIFVPQGFSMSDMIREGLDPKL